MPKFTKNIIIICLCSLLALIGVFLILQNKSNLLDNSLNDSQLGNLDSNRSVFGRRYKTVGAKQYQEFSGYMEYKLFYGPPNFGENPETDAKEPSYILTLFKPVKLKDEDGVTYVKTIHLIKTNSSFINLKNLVNENVTIKGEIEPSFAGHHHGDAIGIVSEIDIYK